MDETDRKILNIIQEEFPITSRPFAEIGKRAGVHEKAALESVKKQKEAGYIRRIGPVLEPKKIDYTSTLCGTHVEEAMLLDVAAEINTHKGVTHNYEREGKLNLWFTITAQSAEEIDAFIESIEKLFGLTIYRFNKKRVFKIRTFFPA